MSDEGPPARQRIAAYALLLRGDEVLMTQMSERTPFPGLWTLPGGGIDHGEDPRDALVREVYEETGLHVVPGTLLDVHSTHFVGARADGLVENYHGVHLIFAAEIEPGSRQVEPHVVEEDSSTEHAAWLSVTEARELKMLSGARHAFDTLLPEE